MQLNISMPSRKIVFQIEVEKRKPQKGSRDLLKLSKRQSLYQTLEKEKAKHLERYLLLS